jgi:hypothetical protein
LPCPVEPLPLVLPTEDLLPGPDQLGRIDDQASVEPFVVRSGVI